jgi:hypothetical protein
MSRETPPVCRSQVKAKRELVQVAKDLERDPAHRALGDAGEEDLAQFGKQRGGKAQRAVEQEQQGGQGECLLSAAQAVDHLLEDQRHGDVGQFGAEQTGQGQQDTPFVLPQIGQQLVQGGPEVAVGQRRG